MIAYTNISTLGRGVWITSVFFLQHMLFFIVDDPILGPGVELDNTNALSCWAAHGACF